MSDIMAFGAATRPRHSGILDKRPTKSRSRAQQILYPSLVIVFVVLSWLISVKSSVYPAVEKALHVRVVSSTDTQHHDGRNATLAKLAKRSGDPNNPTYASRVQTGKTLWCLMENAQATQATWTQADLARWSWDDYDIANEAPVFEGPVAPAYAALGLNTGNDVCRGYLQIDDFIGIDNEEHEGTSGAYQNIVNGPNGVIIAGNNFSPAERWADSHDGSRPQATDLPQLAKWSDIIALQWQQYAAGSTVNYIFRSNIQNDNTKSIIQQAFVASNLNSVPTYPGRDFTVESDGTGGDGDNFYALLGTYHGAGPAYTLAQHRTIYGGMRRIRRIRVWNQGSAWPVGTDFDQLASCMLLFVEAVPQDEEEGGN